MLNDILVLDLTDGQSGFCSKLLADLGATVIKLQPHLPNQPESRPSQDSRRLDIHKLRYPVDLGSSAGKQEFASLLKRSDVLIESLKARDIDLLDLGRGGLRRLTPHLIHVSITPFGRTGPRRNYLSCDAVASAFGGQMYVSGAPSGTPLKLYRNQTEYIASLFGAIAVLIHLRQRRKTGKGKYLDLSIHEAVVSTLDHVLVDFFHGGKIASRGDINTGEGFFVVPAADGYVQITILRNWDTLLELMVSEGMAGDLTEKVWQTASYREEHFDHILEIVGTWTMCRPKREIFELGQALGFPWASVEAIDEVSNSPQLQSRNFFIQNDDRTDEISPFTPGCPYKFSEYVPPWKKPERSEHSVRVPAMHNEAERVKTSKLPEKAIRCADEEILSGLRVLDLTRMLSGPYATRIFADFGAEVLKVQSTNATGAERSDTAFFHTWNRNKKSMHLDLNAPEAKEAFIKLVSQSDVVIENYSPRVMSNLGLDYGKLKRVKPDLVMTSISAMGHSGPWKDFVGFAPTFHSLSGLISATSGSMDPPIRIGHSFGDVIAGLYAALATLASIEHRDRTGKGQHVDVSAYEAMCTLTLAESRSELIEPGSSDGDGLCLPLCRTYKCLGHDRWCVISIENEKQCRILCRIAGIPVFSDERAARWTASQTAESVVEKLQNSGIAAGIVQNAADLARDPQLKARGFFISLSHPSLGKIISDRTALWDWRRKPRNWKLIE